MAKILFLDDMQHRHDEITDALPGHEIFHVYTVEQFRDLIRSSIPFDLVCLDHDLEALQDGRGAVREYLSAFDFCIAGDVLPPVWVHSWNPLRSLEMCRMLLHKRPGLKIYHEPFDPVASRHVAERFLGHV